MPNEEIQGQDEKTLEEMREMLMDEASEIYEGLADDSDPELEATSSEEDESSTQSEEIGSAEDELAQKLAEDSEETFEDRTDDEESEQDAESVGSDEEVEETEESSAIRLDEIEDLSEIVFESGDGESVSLDTLLKERMPRDKFLQKSEEISRLRKEAEASQVEAQRTIENYENMERLALDPRAFVEQYLTMKVNEGVLPKQVLDDTVDAFTQAEEGGIYNPNAIKSQIAQIDKSRELEKARAQAEEEKAAEKARSDVAEIEADRGKPLTQDEKQAIFEKIKEVAAADGYVPSVKMIVRAYGGEIFDEKPGNGKRAASPSKRKIIASIRKRSTTEERPTTGSAPVQRSIEQEAKEVWESLVSM